MTEDYSNDRDSFKVDAEAHKLAGNKLFSAGRFEDALKEYMSAIEKDSNVAVYFSNAATCHSRLSHPEKALELINEAIQLDPDFIKAHYRRGVALVELKRYQEASEDFVRVCREFPADVEAQRKLKACDRELDRKSSFEAALRAGFSAAIKVDRFELTWRCIDGMHFDSTSYTGPTIDSSTSLTVEWVRDELIPFFSADKRLPVKYVYGLLLLAKELFEKEPSLVQIPVEESVTMTVCGDVHGQFFDMLEIFKINGYPSSDHKYLFNGDVVDRGAYSIECLLTFLAFKVAVPAQFFVSRGNHESEPINRVHGFYDECSRKYDHQMFSMANRVLNCLPISYVIGEKIFVVHGGLPEKPDFCLNDVLDLNRFCVPESGSLMSQLLWSDPQEQLGTSPSHRGEGILFGPDVTEAFLKRNNLSMMIRSHVWQNQGYAIEQEGKCVTIFSAPNYTGSISKGGWININSSLGLSYHQFNAAKYQGKAEKPRAGMPIQGGWH